jgi:hypothetical protein
MGRREGYGRLRACDSYYTGRDCCSVGCDSCYIGRHAAGHADRTAPLLAVTCG